MLVWSHPDKRQPSGGGGGGISSDGGAAPPSAPRGRSAWRRVRKALQGGDRYRTLDLSQVTRRTDGGHDNTGRVVLSSRVADASRRRCSPPPCATSRGGDGERGAARRRTCGGVVGQCSRGRCGRWWRVASHDSPRWWSIWRASWKLSCGDHRPLSEPTRFRPPRIIACACVCVAGRRRSDGWRHARPAAPPPSVLALAVAARGR